MENQPSNNTLGVKSLAWRVAGFISLAVAIVGIVLPLVPTTPLLLLSAYCFGRGSERLLRWLLDHPRFGPPIRDWRENRTISRKAKVLAGIAMMMVVGTTILLSAPVVVLVTQIVVLALVSTFIFTRPSSP